MIRGITTDEANFVLREYDGPNNAWEFIPELFEGIAKS
jgi:hypothetical protein